MDAIRLLARILGLAVALALTAAGGAAWIVASRPELAASRGRLVAAARSILPPASVERLLEGPLPIGLAAAGLAIGLVAWLATRRRAAPAPLRADGMPLDRRLARKVQKQANAMVRKGLVRDAAELCLASSLLDRAAELFVEAGDLVRAAEIRHDQNRFDEAAELHLRAGDPESAGSILAGQGEFARAAECFVAAGRMSVAGEMFEKADEPRRAGDCYAKAGFQRQAAQAYIRCQDWRAAAEALEEVVLEESPGAGTGQNPAREAELRKLGLQCGKLYEQAGLLDRAEAILERGGCAVAAAEIALRRERFAKASELFLEGGEPLRAAEVLRRFGEAQEAARILGEYHRSRGEDTEAARYLEEAGDFYAAGDVYRSIQDHARAAEAYEKANDPLQAAEMFRAAGDPARAATNFEQARRWEEAALCHGEAGDPRRQADALARAERLLAAGESYHRLGLADEAIKALQRIPAADPDYPQAAALLGELFQARGQLGLAIKKLRQAIGERELDRSNLRLYYMLATVCGENGGVQEATELYEKILACDYHYEDVEARLAAARAQLELTPSPGSEDGPPSASGRTLGGRYRILAELGRGGMGIVYKAKDTVLDRLVAYKVLPDTLKENPKALANFLREAKSAAQLNHPNIVTVYDAGEQGGRYYIAMEYVDGSTLKAIVRKRGAIAPGGVLHVLVQMCEALAYAHDKKIVHRDIKTANTMWTRDRKAKIMDFGLAKVVEEVRNHTTFVSGTPYYMSPEQTLGRNVDHRTDLYSLGVTLYELATGSLPFTEGNIPYHHVHTEPPDPRTARPDLPPLLAEIIVRCLQKDPADRFQSARDILERVRSAMSRSRPTRPS
jgi:eukaryotic-like serine/threonine-protein kinase